MLQGAAAVGAALVVPVARGAGGGGTLAANGYISITAQGVELALPKTEMGQG
jgi:isoquinoline 1-oxidoreductase beta subunit